MILSRRVEFHGNQLDRVAPEIVIQSVDPGNPKENITAADRLGGFGQRITGEHWQSLEASVTFAINVPKNNMGRRVEVWNLVTAWAANRTGWLVMSFDGRNATKGGGIYANGGQNSRRRMYVDKVIMPSMGDLFKATNEYTIVFRAYNVPFWQDETPTIYKTDTVASATMNLNVPGLIQTPVSISFQNRSGATISNFKIWTALSTIILTDISLGGSETLTISHSDDGIMSIRKGSTSIYSKYTGSDDLLIGTGNKTLKFEATRAGQLTATIYGRYV